VIDLLKRIDLYGSPYHFTVFNNQVYKTHIGGFITILTLIGYIICFWYFGNDFYSRENPKYLNERINLPVYPNYTLNRDDLMIAIRMEDTDGNFFDPSGLLDIEVVYYNYETIDGEFQLTKYTNLSIINCTEIDMNALRMKTKKDISQMSCIKFNNTPLGGYWDTDFTNYIMINFKPCLNTTENNNYCIPREKALDRILKEKLSFNLYTNMYFTDLKDYENPLKVNMYNIFGYVDAKIGKNIRLYYKQAIISTDMGLLTEMQKGYSVFGLDYIISDTISVLPSYENSGDKTTLASFEIYLGNNREKYDVTYKKLQETIADVGGFLSLTTFALSFIANFFNEHYRSNEIINYLFDFNDLKDSNKLDNFINKKLDSKDKFDEIIKIQKYENINIRRKKV